MSKKSGMGKFILGAGLGAGLALLFAPQEGSKTRRELKIKFNELVEKAKLIDTDDVKADILQRVEELRMQVKDLDKEKALEITEQFVANWEIWQIVGFLDKFGIGPQSAETIYKKLGVNAIEEIQANPYILVDLVNKVNFNQVKDYALKAAREVVSKLESEEESNKKVNKKKTVKKPSSNK